MTINVNQTDIPAITKRLFALIGGLVVFLFAGVICLETVAYTQQQAGASPFVKIPFGFERTALLKEGAALSEHEAADLQTQVDNDTVDVVGRFKLLAYYGCRSTSGAETRSSFLEAASWFVNNCPEEGDTVIALLFSRQPEDYLELKKQWMEVIKKHPNNVKIICNTAMLALLQDPDWANTLIDKAEQLEIKDSVSAKRMGMVYGFRLISEHGKKKREEYAEQAIEHYELAIKLTEDRSEVSPIRLSAANVAMDAGLLESASTYAQQVLKDQDSGDSIHRAHTILGCLALQSGDRDKAKTHLLAAGKVSSTPELLRAGPDMLLASKLLIKDETEVVLEYFELCEKFWKKPELKQWVEQVKQGEIPDFGMHLSSKSGIDW